MFRSLATFCYLMLFLLFVAAHLGASPLFQHAQAYDSGGTYTFSVVVADVNRDGTPDLVFASQCLIGAPCNYNEGDTGAVSVSLGNGDGTFQPPQTYSTGGGTAYSVAVADVNRDGKPDILVVNACAGPGNCSMGTIGVLLGNGDGTFQPAKSYSSGGEEPFAIAVADVNGDGKPDVLVGNGCAIDNCGKSVVSLLLGNGDGTFQGAQAIDTVTLDAEAIAVQDVNGDGKPDLLIVSFCISGTDCSGAFNVLLGNGDGTFQLAHTYNTGGYGGTAISVADVNGDGKFDVIVTNTYISASDESTGSVSVFLGNGDGSFQAPATYASGGFSTLGVAVADVDGDSKPDILTGNSCRTAPDGSNCVSGVVGFLQGNGDGTFRAPVSFWSGGIQSKKLAVADFNHDGRPDVVIANTCVSGSTCAYGSGGVLINTGKYETATTLLCNLNPAVYGQPVTLTATVTSIGPDSPTGRVSFKNSGAALGAATLNGGIATLTKSNLAVGDFTVSAVYIGDAASGESTSPLLNLLVKEASSTTMIASSPNPSSAGQKVTLTSNVSSPTSKVTGAVVFTAGTTTIGTATIEAGKATLVTTALPTGSNSITAAYSGTTDIEGSSASLVQVVK
jgi:hypothetical protein